METFCVELFPIIFCFTKPLPRKGMETDLSTLTYLLVSRLYKTSSPQGDGNAMRSGRPSREGRFTKPLPRKGMETFVPGYYRWKFRSLYKTSSPQGDGNPLTVEADLGCVLTLQNLFPARGWKIRKRLLRIQ